MLAVGGSAHSAPGLLDDFGLESDGHIAEVTQVGEYNQATITQENHLQAMTAKVHTSGNFNIIVIDQDNSSLANASVKTLGDGSRVTIEQQDSLNALATVDQRDVNSSGVTINQIQSSGASALIIQRNKSGGFFLLDSVNQVSANNSSAVVRQSDVINSGFNIDQTGNGNSAGIQETDAVFTRSVINQDGYINTATIVRSFSSGSSFSPLQADITQVGVGNSAQIKQQDLSYGGSVITQIDGDGNYASTTQSGAYKSAGVLQSGSDNWAKVYQYGISPATTDAVNISQYGVGHSADVRQNGTGGNLVTILQNN